LRSDTAAVGGLGMISPYCTGTELSQRDRATLRVIEYFAKSLKVTKGHSK